jgi:hypothetical protein
MELEKIKRFAQKKRWSELNKIVFLKRKIIILKKKRKRKKSFADKKIESI